MVKTYAESIALQTQAQQATIDGHTNLNETFLSNTNICNIYTWTLNNDNQPASCSHSFS